MKLLQSLLSYEQRSRLDYPYSHSFKELALYFNNKQDQEALMEEQKAESPEREDESVNEPAQEVDKEPK